MKYLTQIFGLVVMLALVGCGESTSNAPANTATPGEVVKELADAMANGNADKLKELIPDFEAKFGGNAYVIATRMAESARAVGGVASVTIDDEKIKGDKAVVTATLTNGKGGSSTQTFNLIKQDGKWVVKIDDSAIKDAPQEEAKNPATPAGA